MIRLYHLKIGSLGILFLFCQFLITVTEAMGQFNFTSKQLVELKNENEGLIIEMKYFFSDNITGSQIYRENRCFLHKKAREGILKANNFLKKHGLRLKLLDCFRPLSAQKALWKIKPDERFVANPEKGSNHNRGIAVDVTLVDFQGKELQMPTGFDDFSEKSYSDYKNLPLRVVKNRALLKKAMRFGGFSGIRYEWWHFVISPVRNYPLLLEGR